MTDVLSLSGGVGKSSRRESKRSQLQTQQSYHQQGGEKKVTEAVKRFLYSISQSSKVRHTEFVNGGVLNSSSG